MCIFIKKNGKRLLSLALVPFVAINIYAGSKLLKNDKLGEKETKQPKSSTTQMVDMKDYREVLSSSLSDEEVENEKSVFEKLQEIYASSNKNFSEIINSEVKSSELYASGLYAKLKSFGLSDEIIRSELDNVLAFSLTFTDMDDETWTRLFGNMESTIGEYENVMDYYYPLAIYVHKNQCELEHQPHEFDDTRMTCAILEEITENAITILPSSDYVIDMIKASEDTNIINQYNKIVNSGINFDDAMVELNSIFDLSQMPMCIDEDTWNKLFKNLLTTVGEYDNVFEVYGDLACYIHELSCDFEHYTDEYGINVCEGLKLAYTYEN